MEFTLRFGDWWPYLGFLAASLVLYLVRRRPDGSFWGLPAWAAWVLMLALPWVFLAYGVFSFWAHVWRQRRTQA